MKTFSSCFSQGAKIHLGITYLRGWSPGRTIFVSCNKRCAPPIYFLFRASCIVASVSYSILPNNQLFVFRYSILLPSNLTNIFSKARHQTDSLTASLLLRFSECIKMFLHFSDKTCQKTTTTEKLQFTGFLVSPEHLSILRISISQITRS